eukprot:PhF_6_TR33802/c0_g1_i1/m.49575
MYSPVPTGYDVDPRNATRLRNVARGYYEDLDLDGFVERDTAVASNVNRFDREPADGQYIRMDFLFPRFLLLSTIFFTFVLFLLSAIALFIRNLRDHYNQWLQFTLCGIIGTELMMMGLYIVFKNKENIVRQVKGVLL